jgi:hypothetical protein
MLGALRYLGELGGIRICTDWTKPDFQGLNRKSNPKNAEEPGIFKYAIVYHIFDFVSLIWKQLLFK